jgi:hypothetical protein
MCTITVPRRFRTPVAVAALMIALNACGSNEPSNKPTGHLGHLDGDATQPHSNAARQIGHHIKRLATTIATRDTLLARLTFTSGQRPTIRLTVP